MSVSYANTNPESIYAELIKQGCQIGIDDAENGRVMDSTIIKLKNASDKSFDLESRIRKEYEKCYSENNSINENTPVSSIDSGNSDNEAITVEEEKPTIIKPKKEKDSTKRIDDFEVKLPPKTSAQPFAWFHDWMSAVKQAPARYTREKKHAEGLRQEFIKSCQKAYLIDQNDSALIKRWCIISGWEDFKSDLSASYDDPFKNQLEQMQVQIGYSELSFSKDGDREVKNAFDRTKGEALDYKMTIIEETKVLPYISGINVALENIKAINIAMESLDEKVISERKSEYLAELKLREKKRIAEEKKRLQQLQHQRYLTQKKQADKLSDIACNKAREDAINLKKLQPDQYKSEATVLDLIDGVEKLIAARFTDCYDAQLLSLTCEKAGEDYMKCVDEGPADKHISLASKKISVDAFKAQYKKCQNDRKDLYVSEKIKKERTHRKILSYSEIYRDKGGYFINDYNECVTSLISATNKIPDKLQFLGLSVNEVRSCENISKVLEKYASRSCACSYGVVVETLNNNQFTELSEDILTLIKLSHSDIENNQVSKSDGKKFFDSLVYPEQAVEVLNKISSECVM